MKLCACALKVPQDGFLVVISEHPLTQHQHERVTEMFRNVAPGMKVVVIGGGITLVSVAPNNSPPMPPESFEAFKAITDNLAGDK